jgi:hypothetical protein
VGLDRVALRSRSIQRVTGILLGGEFFGTKSHNHIHSAAERPLMTKGAAIWAACSKGAQPSADSATRLRHRVFG